MNQHETASNGRKLRILTILCVALAAALTPSSVAAAPIGLGQIAPAATMSNCSTGSAELLQLQQFGGVNSYVAPADGRIISWSTMAGTASGQQVWMRVYRAVPGQLDTYVVVAEDGPRAVKPSSFNSFATAVPVQAGDFLGIASGPGSKAAPVSCLFATGRITDILSIAEQQVPVGGTAVIPAVAAGGRPNIAATMVPRPVVSSLAPATGPTGGGTQVAIRGAHLDGATAVSFGGRPASGFTVLSDGEIVAVAPPGTPGAVNVTVAAADQASPSAARYVYEAAPWVAPSTGSEQGRARSLCVVPNLIGKKIKAVRRILRRANCKLGIASGPRRRAKAKVRRQVPREGRALGAGSSVDVVLSLQRRRR